MFAFLPPTPLLLRTHAHAFRACAAPLTNGSPSRRARVSMLTMDDLPEPLRLPDRPRIGFSTYSEKLNGRLAMIGFVAAVVIELATGQGLVPLLTALLSK